MRLGLVWLPYAAAHYRALYPAEAMARRGHEIVGPPSGHGEVDPRRLSQCDVVHVYRRCDERARRALSELSRRGTPIVYDNDDDFAAVPKGSPTYKNVGGLQGQRRFADSVKLAKLARVFTTTNEVLAEKYRASGVERAEVIENYLSRETVRPRRDHSGVVIGWIAGLEHQADLDSIKIVEALERLLAKHADLRVECVGVDLRLRHRYRHDAELPFSELPGRIGGFDIGIAPLADIPMNRARSNIKVKEYAASGVPWLASPVGPYRGLGETEGGRLVADDRWFEELDRLVASERDRERLGRNGEGWARTQTLEAVAARWEETFAAVAGLPGARTRGAGGIALRPGVTIRVRPGRR